MPVDFAVYLLLAVLGVVIATGPLRIHPFIAMTLAVMAFGLACDEKLSLIGNAYSAGFVETLNSVGLVIVAAAIVGAIGAGSGASARLAAAFAGWGGGRMSALMAALGFVAGVAASPAAAFAALMPFRQTVAAGSRRANAVSSVTLGLGLSASHGMLLPAPCPIAAAAILAADPLRVLAFGAPVAALAAVAGAIFARLAGGRLVAEGPMPDPALPAPTPPAGEQNASPRVVAALLLPVLAMVLLLMVQSLGEIPSEPFGGGPTRELLLGLGRPAILLVVGVGIALLLTWRWGAEVLSQQGWVGQAIAGAADLLLLVGAGGALQKLIQETGMAELLAEPLLDWRGGLALPFAVAALVKCLQGSSLVAAITAAGMVAPLLAPLGLASETGRALAVVAVGAGAMSGSNLNDGFFWLVTANARLTPGRGLALHSAGTLLQGILALLLLLLLGLLVG
jgi:gluconate:H+ symporter, GntP family